MCEKKTCPHRGDDMCTCMKRGNTAEEWIADLVHLCGHITEAKWELEYTALDSPKQRRLCLVGHCRSCGKRLCTGVHIPETLDRDEFLSAAFLHMGLYGRSIGMDTASPAFREMFTSLFHREDQTILQEWLSRPENREANGVDQRQEPSAPEQDDSVTVYTIVRTSADADRGFFPDPSSEGSYLSLHRAREKLQELIREAKEELDGRYDCEEQNEDCWEMYQGGYAAALFTRFEILPSKLIASSAEQRLRDGQVKECEANESGGEGV